MNAPISSNVIHVEREPRRWQKPVFDAVQLVKAHELKLLGELRGRNWYVLPGRVDAELVERPLRLSDADRLPNGVLAQRDDGGARSYAVFDYLEPGTYQRLLTEPPVRIGPPPPRPGRLVEATPVVFAPPRYRALGPRVAPGAGNPGFIVAEETEDNEPPIPAPASPRSRIRGPEAILGHLRKKGIEITLAGDRAHLLVKTPGGHPLMLGERALVEASAPLLLGHLLDAPLACAVKKHDRPTIACAILLGGCPCCAECLEGGAK
jgi:hypothetical protein